MSRLPWIGLSLVCLTVGIAACVVDEDQSGLEPVEFAEPLIAPERFLFPRIPADASIDSVVCVTNMGGGRLAIRDIQGPFEGQLELFRRAENGEDHYLIDAQGQSHGVRPIVLGPGETLSLVLSYQPGVDGHHPEGEGPWVLRLETNLPESVLTIPIVTSGNDPEIKIAPPSLDFGRVPAGEITTLPVTVTNIGNWALGMRQIVISGSQDFTVLINGRPITVDALSDPDGDGEGGLASGQQATLEVTYAPASDGPDTAELTVDPRKPEVSVNLMGNGATPCVRVEPPDVGFGAVSISQTGQRPLRIESCGGQPLEIVAVEIDERSDAAFSLDRDSLPAPLRAEPPEPETVAAHVQGEPSPGRNLTVLFRPDEARAYEGWLTVHTNDPARSMITVPLVGRGMHNVCPQPRIAGETDLIVSPLDVVVLNGRTSVDPDGPGGLPVAYHWTVIERPDGSTAQPVESFFARQRPADGGSADDPSTPTALFFVDLVGHYTFELHVTDASGLIAPSEDCPDARAVVTLEAWTDHDIHVQLVWTTPGDPDETDMEGTDLDLHFMHPIHQGWMTPPADCFYMNPNPDWGALGDPSDNPMLDVDDINGAGPENINLDHPENTRELGGHYKIGVHYYRSGTAVSPDLGPSFATIRIYLNGQLLWENAEPRALEQTNDFWEVGGIVWTPEERRFVVTDVVFRM